jgi:shikimate kinase
MDYYDYGARVQLGRPAVVTGYLTGFTRGATYRAAAMLGISYRDVDRQVEHVAGSSVPRLLVEGGEGRYRELEARVLEQTLRERPAGVIALGDGGLLDAGSLDRVQEKADLVVFDFGIGNLLWRVQQMARQPERSPWHTLLRDTPESIADLRPFYQERRAGFDQADVTIVADSLSVPGACDALMMHLAG